MLEVSDFPAPTASVMASVVVLVYGFPVWALMYFILGLGSYTYLNQ